MNKAQAAMEFVMSYAWAIMIVLIAIGALAYFGVLNPSRYLPDACTLQPGLACLDFTYDKGINELRLVIMNSMGFDMKDVYVRVPVCRGNFAFFSDDGTTLNNDQKGTYYRTCSSTLPPGPIKANFTFSFNRVEGESAGHTVLGTLRFNVQ